MASQLKIDPEAVRALAELLRETDLTEIEYQLDSLRIKVSRTVVQTSVNIPAETALLSSLSAPANTSVASATAAPAANNLEPFKNLENHPGVIEAQMVGVIYLAPGPGAEPFMKLGERVEQGQTLFIIEAMKVMNMIKSPRSGIVKHIFVKDGQPVEYGDPIVIVE